MSDKYTQHRLTLLALLKDTYYQVYRHMDADAEKIIEDIVEKLLGKEKPAPSSDTEQTDATDGAE